MYSKVGLLQSILLLGFVVDVALNAARLDAINDGSLWATLQSLSANQAQSRRMQYEPQTYRWKQISKTDDGQTSATIVTARLTSRDVYKQVQEQPLRFEARPFARLIDITAKLTLVTLDTKQADQRLLRIITEEHHIQYRCTGGQCRAKLVQQRLLTNRNDHIERDISREPFRLIDGTLAEVAHRPRSQLERIWSWNYGTYTALILIGLLGLFVAAHCLVKLCLHTRSQ